MYLSLKTILLGAVVASAIPFSPNGTYNVTKEIKAHPSIFGLPWTNPDNTNPLPKNVTLDGIHKILECLLYGTHNDTRYDSPRIGATGIRKDGGRVGHPSPPPKDVAVVDCLYDAFPHLNETIYGAPDVKGRDSPKLPHYIKWKDGNKVGHPSPPRRDLTDVLEAIRRIVKEAHDGANGAAHVERRDSAVAAPDALQGGGPFCKLRCMLTFDLKCPGCRGGT